MRSSLPGAPISAVLPSAESATLVPNPPSLPISLPAGQLRPLLGPHPARAREHPRRALRAVVVPAADQRGVAVGGERDEDAELAVVLFAAGELRSLLAPRPARAGEGPRRARGGVVLGPADQRGVAVGRERDARAEFAFSGLAGAGELSALLGPGRARAREHPGRADVAVVAGPADQRGVAVGGERDARAEPAVSDLAGAGQLFALLSPGRARAREHPGRAGFAVVVGAPPTSAVLPSAESATLVAESAFSGLAGAGELSALLGPGRARAREHPGRARVAVVARARRSARCCRRRRAPRSKPNPAFPISPVPMSFPPCWVQVEPERVNTQAAPVLPLSSGPPISAVSPSAESATLSPNLPSPVSPVPVSFSPCWLQVEPERVNTQAAPLSPSSRGPPISAVLPSAESATLVAEFAFCDVGEFAFSGVARADELSALLGPGRARAREHPGGADAVSPPMSRSAPPISAVLPSPESATA